MKKTKKIIVSIIIILIFLSLFMPKSHANFFTDSWGEEDSDIEKSIDSEDGGIFEKIIAKMIGGIAETVFTVTTSKEFGVGFKGYDELIFAKDTTAISPFTNAQWSLLMKWYRIMSTVAGSLILIVVVIISYRLITGGYSVEKRSEAKDSLMRLFFGAAAIIFAPIFVKFLLFLNNNLVHMLIGLSDRSLDDLIGNKILNDIQTGNAIATAIVIAMFAYLFVKLNVKFIIRQFTILVFTLFTPIVAIMWMINKRTIGASIWFGQILINVFMQFIYAFLFLVYLQFLPQAGGWAVSLLWAMMILPLADALQNTLQNLVSRIAGVNNDELANRGIGMAGAMAYSVKAIAYQFKNPDGSIGGNGTTGFMGRLFGKNTDTTSGVDTMKSNPMQINPMKTNVINNNGTKNNQSSENKESKSGFNVAKVIDNVSSAKNIGKKAFNTGKEIMNMGMYMAEGRNFRNQNTFDSNRNYSRYNINNSRKEDFTKENNQNSVIANMKDDDANGS